MAKETMRTHVVIGRDLVEEVDRLVGSRSRSRFFTSAVEEKLSRIRLMSAARKAAGSLEDVDVPGWETSESAAEWVRASSKADEEKLRRVLEEN